MASSSLPSGAFLTTISGRRCTAVPRVKAVPASASSDTSSTTRATTTTSSVRTTAVNRTTALAAAPVAEIDTVTEQSSTSTTPSSFVTTTTSTPPGSVRIAQAQDSESGSSARPSTSLPAAVPATSSATPKPFTAFADVASSQTSEAQSSQADGSVTAPAADTPAVSSDPPSAETSAPDLPKEPAATPLLTTLDLPQTPTDTPVPEGTATTSADPGLTAIPTLNNNAVQSTVAVAGGVIGGVVAISVLAFFIWWWRRRMLRKRRSTLLTPLDLVPSYDRDEKGGYVITRGSIGPTPVTEKFRAALGQNFKKIRGHIRNRTAPSVNLDRGTSQFIDPKSTHSRANSGIIGAEPTAKDRLRDWWSSLGMRFSRRDKNAGEKSTGVAQEKRPASRSQPDFLTLLNMDNPELDREAQRRRASIARAKGGSASSTDNFLGGLHLNFSSDDPFSDANAIAHISAKPAPLAVASSTSNPFSDSNAIRDPALPKPATYVADIRRSRSNSVATARRQVYSNYPPTNRDSAGSLATLATTTTANQRTKFRSDPFDLERPELLGGAAAQPIPASSNITNISNNNRSSSVPAADTDGGGLNRPTKARTSTSAVRRERAESFNSSRYSKYSKYSSGISVLSAVESMGEWSDPGPDVGPAASRTQVQGQAQGQGQGQRQGQSQGQGWGVLPDGNGVGVQGWRERLVREREEALNGSGSGNESGRRTSGGSLGSVGKAM